MDVGNKTLSQLSEEAKEKRYVALDVGAKVSGYTTEYLERLCRLNKVEYRIWNNGQFVIELESLLRETHTILLSYEDIVFVEKSELLDPTAQIVGEVLSQFGQDTPSGINALAAAEEATKMLSQKTSDGITQQVPTFGTREENDSQRNGDFAFSFTGRAVESDPLHPVSTKEEHGVRVFVASEDAKNIVTAPHVEGVPIVPQKKSVHIPLTINSTYPESPAFPKVHLSVVNADLPKIATVLPMEAEHDEWDSMVLGVPNVEGAPIVEPVPIPYSAPAPLTRATMSPVQTPALHPIQTSVDATEHHDDAPLFPQLENNIVSIPTNSIARGMIPQSSSFPGIPDLGTTARVVVFSPSEITKARQSASPEAPAQNPPSILDVPPASVALLFDKTVLPQPITPPVLTSVPERSLERVVTTLPGTPSMVSLSSNEEHHLLVREKFALTKSPAFNVVFVGVLIASTLAIVGGTSLPFFGQPITYIAGVAGTDNEDASLIVSEPNAQQNNTTSESAVTYPFSDDVEIATTTDNSVAITPVFNSNEGNGVEYVIELTGSGEATFSRE